MSAVDVGVPPRSNSVAGLQIRQSYRTLHSTQPKPILTSMKLASIICSVAILGTILLQPSASAQQAVARQKMDVSKLGPQVGEQVPDFSLKDQDGKTRNLESIMGPKGTMLVFVRSADW